MNETGTARDFRGYGRNPPHPQWPGNARIAININLNYEGGGESCVVDGDAESEGMLNDIGAPAYAGLRSPLTESEFEYGSRVGIWRVLRILPNTTCTPASSASCRRWSAIPMPPAHAALLREHIGGRRE